MVQRLDPSGFLAIWLHPHLPAFLRLTTFNSRKRSTWSAAHGHYYTRDVTIKRLDHVSFVADDPAAALVFFVAVEGAAPFEGPWVERVNGFLSVQVDIVKSISQQPPS